MIFASDYLHFDALFVGETGHDGLPYPGTVATLMARNDISDAAQRKMMLDNSIKFYEFERSDLGAIGDPVAQQETEEARMVMPGTISAR